MQHLHIFCEKQSNICSVEFHCFQVYLDEEIFWLKYMVELKISTLLIWDFFEKK